VKDFFKDKESWLDDTQMGYHRDCLYVSVRVATANSTTCRQVLRYYIPKQSWTVHPDLNASCFMNWNQGSDQDEFFYGDAYTNVIYKLNYATRTFNGTAITSQWSTGYINIVDSELAVTMLTFKAKGSGTLLVIGYNDQAEFTGIYFETTLTSVWQTFTAVGPVLHEHLRGDFIKILFRYSTSGGSCKLKDLALYMEKIPKRGDFNEVTVNELVGP